MARKARGGLKRIQFGVQKYKIRLKRVDHDSGSTENQKQRKIFGIPLDFLSKVASKCLSLNCWYCFNLCLAPITTTKGSMNLEDVDNNLVISTGFRRVCHYLVIITFILDLCFKFFMSMSQVLNYPMDDINTILCLIVAVGIIFIFAMSTGSLMRPEETVDLINSWSSVLGHLRDRSGNEYSTFGEPSIAIKIIVATVSPFFVVTAYTFIIILWPSVRLPFMYSVLYENNISSNTISSIWLRLIFSPLEFLSLLLPLMNVLLQGLVLETSLSVLRTQAEATRNIPINNLADRRVVEQLYMCLEVGNRILNPWYKFIVPQSLFAAGAVITVALYISIRNTQLPFFLYMNFPYIAVVVGTAVFSMCWDTYVVIRASEDLVSTFRSGTPAYFLRLAPSERAYSMKRAKAFRTSFFHIGIFSEFSLSVPVAFGEEILNQLLFFLSLTSIAWLTWEKVGKKFRLDATCSKGKEKLIGDPYMWNIYQPNAAVDYSTVRALEAAGVLKKFHEFFENREKQLYDHFVKRNLQLENFNLTKK